MNWSSRFKPGDWVVFKGPPGAERRNGTLKRYYIQEVLFSTANAMYRAIDEYLDRTYVFVENDLEPWVPPKEVPDAKA